MWYLFDLLTHAVETFLTFRSYFVIKNEDLRTIHVQYSLLIWEKVELEHF